MNYPDEEYVRYYTRETITWLALGWEGQCVFALMLHGKFDRSGVFDCGSHTPSHAVTLVTRCSEHVVEVGLQRLFETETWVLREGRIVWPKYLEAQTCRRTDRARQEESRRIRRDSSLGARNAPGDETSPPVTRGHTESQPVTQSRAEQSRAEGKAQRERSAPDLAPPDLLARDWRPDADCMQVLATETQRPTEILLRQLPGFIDWFTNGKGKTKRRKLAGWRTSWMTWVRRSAADGKLDLAPQANLTLVSPADSEARARRAAEVEARAAAARQA